jgi:hypothetical protein
MIGWHRTDDTKQVFGILLAMIMILAINMYRFRAVGDGEFPNPSNLTLLCIAAAPLIAYALFLTFLRRSDCSIPDSTNLARKMLVIYSLSIIPLLILAIFTYDNIVARNISERLFGGFSRVVLSVPPAYVLLEGEKTKLGTDLDVKTVKGFLAQRGSGWLVVTEVEPSNAFNDTLPIKWQADGPIKDPDWGQSIGSLGSVSSNKAVMEGAVRMPSPVNQITKIRAYLLMPVVYPIRSGVGAFTNVSTDGRGGNFSIVVLPISCGPQLEIFRNARRSVVSLIILSLLVPLAYGFLLHARIVVQRNR